jgi:hypothetical protein
MKNLSSSATVYVTSVILIGFVLMVWMLGAMEWGNVGLYLLAALGAMAQTIKVDGPDARTNYSIAWFVYGFAFIALGPVPALFVVLISHLVEWIWHKYPWYIQSFNIGAHLLPVFLAGLVHETVSQGTQVLDLASAMGLAAANLVFVFGNHLLVGMVVKLARGQSFAESGVLGFYTLFLDFTVLSMGAMTALLWSVHPLTSILNILPLYLLYNALRVPRLEHQLRRMKRTNAQMGLDTSGD